MLTALLKYLCLANKFQLGNIAFSKVSNTLKLSDWTDAQADLSLATILVLIRCSTVTVQFYKVPSSNFSVTLTSQKCADRVTYLEGFAVLVDVPSRRTFLRPVESAMVEILLFSLATKIYNKSQSKSCRKQIRQYAGHTYMHTNCNMTNAVLNLSLSALLISHTFCSMNSQGTKIFTFTEQKTLISLGRYCFFSCRH